MQNGGGAKQRRGGSLVTSQFEMARARALGSIFCSREVIALLRRSLNFSSSPIFFFFAKRKANAREEKETTRKKEGEIDTE